MGTDVRRVGDTFRLLSLEDKVERVKNLVNSLRTENRIETLKMIFDVISCLRTDSLNKIALNVELRNLFDCLNTTEEEELELSCRILKLLLGSIDSLVIFERCGDCLSRAIRHPHPDVISLVLREVLRASVVPDLRPVVCSEDFLQQAIIHIFDEDLKIYKLVSYVMSELVIYPPATEIIFSPTSIDLCKSSMEKHDKYAIRVYEVFVEMALKSPQILNECVKCGLLSELIGQIRKDDPLLQLNVLELLTTLCSAPHGFQYLMKNDVFKFLATELFALPSKSTYGLLLGGVLKTFAVASKLNPGAVFPDVVNWMIDTIQNETCESNICAIFEALSIMTSTPRGKLALKQQGSNIEAVLATFPDRVRKSSAVTKVRLLEALTEMFSLKEEFQTTETLGITYQWYKAIHQRPLDVIVSYCYQPFADLQLAALSFLQALAEQPWGVREIMNQVGLIEYLMDRNQASNIFCKKAKYDIVYSLLNSVNAATEFSINILQQMRLFVQVGPYSDPTHMEVALEEQGV